MKKPKPLNKDDLPKAVDMTMLGGGGQSILADAPHKATRARTKQEQEKMWADDRDREKGLYEDFLSPGCRRKSPIFDNE